MLDIVDVGSNKLITKSGGVRPSTIAEIIFELSVVDISRGKLVNSSTALLVLFEGSIVYITVGCCQFTLSMSSKSASNYAQYILLYMLERTLT